MTIHAQKKGKAGEVQFCSWLRDNLNIDAGRNCNQANGHSADVITDDFIFEVKRCETISLVDWWHQISVAKQRHENEFLIPVVAFRQNRKPWSFAVPAKLLPGVSKGYMVIQERVFIEFAKAIIKPLRKKVLRKSYENFKDQFKNDFADTGCTCDDDYAVCYYCIHPGNTSNLNKNDDAWEYV